MIASYPEAEETATDPQAERIMESVIEIVHAIRNARAQHKVESSKWIEAQIYAGELTLALTPHSETIQTLARVKPVTILENREGLPGKDNLVLVLNDLEVAIPMASMVDQEAERERLQKEIAQTQAAMARLEARLNDTQFLTKAPAAVVEKERNNLAIGKDKLERLKEQLNRFQA